MDNSRLTRLHQFLEKDPEDSFLLFAVAKEYESLGISDKALQQFLVLKEKNPEYIGLYYHLGKLYELLQEEALALQTYEQGMELAKKLKDFHALSELNNAKTNLELSL